ncbi:pyridoxal 5'-phosphate synthase glutaminase subunit PdxT [Candidatus Micrarchaeota archaeon]|nr:pyridoxal 5'-phosphate synthase glutaminase subunit PdxT [Candidatus Micrarchaeota archaeon]
MTYLHIAVLGLQGAVFEHITATSRAMQTLGLFGDARWAKNRAEVEAADGVIIPGGESTTICNLIEKSGLRDLLLQKPVFGTCAGLVLLAKQGDGQVEKTGQRLLERMDFAVNRNAFGRQRESFQTDIEFESNAGHDLQTRPFPGVFIRAPAIEKTWGDCHVLARLDGKIIAAEQGDCLATAFHPELTDDTRIHEYFLQKVAQRS